MKTRTLGPNRPEVSAIGLGCMGLSHAFGPATERRDAVRLIQLAVEHGYTFFDTAEIYGPYENEEIVGEALAGQIDNLMVATKFGIAEMSDKTDKMKLDSSPEAIRRSAAESMRRLRTDHIDLYYQHRQDPATPIEVVAETMRALIDEGLVLHWGISAVDADTIRRAHAVCPLTAVESEYSMVYRHLENDVLPVCEELDIALVPYSPLAKGFLSGKVAKGTAFAEGDLRAIMARFKPEVMDVNQALLDFLEAYAEERGATPAQIALAWVLARNPYVVPIPGARNEKRLKENADATEISFTNEEYAEFNTRLEQIHVLQVNF